MKLYDGGRAPNPRRVRMFLAEKGITVPLEPVDLGAMQHRSPEFAAINPLQRLPALQLDDGAILTESMAICRYFEGLKPEPPLLGRDFRDQAFVEMWNRRVELHLLLPVMAAFRHCHPAMKEMEVPQIPAWGEVNRERAVEFLTFLDGELAHRAHVAGEDFTVADITAFIAVDFMKPAKITVPDGLSNLQRWRGAVAARPSASA